MSRSYWAMLALLASTTVQAAAGFEELMRALTLEVANNPQPPHRKPDSFFRRFATERELEPRH